MSKTVLIVDDEESIVELFQDALEHEGYETLGAYSGNQAIDLLKKQGYGIDMILSDIKMSDGSGVDLLKFVKTQYAKIPIAMVSGYTSQTSENLLELGARQILMKPIAVDDIVRTVKLCLGPVKKIAC